MNRKKLILFIVILLAVLCLLAAVYCFARPAASGDYFVLSDTDSDRFTYELHLGAEVSGGELYAEQWVNGTCVRSAPVAITETDDTLSIFMQERREEGSAVGMDIQLESRPYGGILLTYFPHPDDMDILGRATTGYELDERRVLAPGDEVILAAWVFDSGGGVRVFDCETLISEPERLEEAKYMIVLRAIFNV